MLSIDRTPNYYSRHLHAPVPPLLAHPGAAFPFMEDGTPPYPTTPTSDPEAAAAFGFTFGARHPTPAELRAHLEEAYGGEGAASLVPDAQLRRHLAEVGGLEAVMRGVALSSAARGSARGSFAGGQQGAAGCALRAEGDSYVFEAATPGVRKEDLSLEVIGRRLQLTISEPGPHSEAARPADRELEQQQHAATDAAAPEPADPPAPTVEAMHEIEVEGPSAAPASAPQAAPSRTQARVAAVRSVSLPADADPSSVVVSYDLGVLRVYIARSDGTTPAGPEGEAARAARERVSELREQLRAAEREAAEAEAGARRAVVEARRAEISRHTVIAI